MEYVYLNTYKNGYLYVGSHTWNGPEGQLDPSYHGSSTFVLKEKWVPVKEEILEVVSKERKLVAEREWIERYAKMYGIARQVKVAAWKRGNHWVDMFRDGLLLNAHSNSAYQMHSEEVNSKRNLSLKNVDYSKAVRASLDARNKDSYKRMVETKRSKGVLGVNAKHLHTPEAVAKGIVTRKLNGTQNNIQKYLTKEVIAKSMETRRRNATKFEVYKDGVFLQKAHWRLVCKITGMRKKRSSDVKDFIEYKGYMVRRIKDLV